MGRNGLKWVILKLLPRKGGGQDVDGRVRLRDRRKRPFELSGKVSRRDGRELCGGPLARLVAYPTDKWQEQAEKLKALAGIKNRLIVSYLFASGIVVQPDKQGRILLPGGHREHAQLEKEVTIIGVGDHAEIWNTHAWHEAMNTVDSAKLEAALLEMGL